MKQLLGVLFMVVLAVAITLFSQGNVAKVVVFFNAYRIDVSLNATLVLLACTFLVLHGLLLAIRYSSQVPGRVRDYLGGRRQAALLKANTEAFLALVLGDANTANSAWVAAQKTQVDNDLSHLLRALFAIETHQWDTAKQTLQELAQCQARRQQANKARKSNAVDSAVMLTSQSSMAMQVLSARVALHQGDAVKALAVLQALPAAAQGFVQTLRLSLFALQDLQQWPAALHNMRQCLARLAITPAEHAQVCLSVYQGLLQQAGLETTAVEAILQDAQPVELKHLAVVEAMCAALLRVGLLEPARLLLENALNQEHSLALLPWYHAVATSAPSAAMPFVEALLDKHPNDLPVQELAGDVFAEGLLWGKAIACFERVYEAQASSHMARKLERIYRSCNQLEKARVWAARMV